jgi:hypothetical protein
MPIEKTWLMYLAIPATWTILFSMSNTPGIRGWRNLGILACYVVGIVMLLTVGWRRSGATWSVVGVATGLLYYLYDLWGSWGDAEQQGGRARLATVLHGLFIWPVMLPEVIEYSLAEAGVLRSDVPKKSDGPQGPEAL